jgi:hypothetical protein
VVAPKHAATMRPTCKKLKNMIGQPPRQSGRARWRAIDEAMILPRPNCLDPCAYTKDSHSLYKRQPLLIQKTALYKRRPFLIQKAALYKRRPFLIQKAALYKRQPFLIQEKTIFLISDVRRFYPDLVDVK